MYFNYYWGTSLQHGPMPAPSSQLSLPASLQTPYTSWPTASPFSFRITTIILQHKILQGGNHQFCLQQRKKFYLKVRIYTNIILRINMGTGVLQAQALNLCMKLVVLQHRDPSVHFGMGNFPRGFIYNRVKSVI